MKLFNNAGKKEAPNQAPASSVSNNTVQQPEVAATTPSAQPASNQTPTTNNIVPATTTTSTTTITTGQTNQSISAGTNPNNTVMSQDKIMPLAKEDPSSKTAPSNQNKLPTPKANANQDPDILFCLGQAVNGVMIDHINRCGRLLFQDMLLYMDCFSYLLKSVGYADSEIKSIYPQIVKQIVDVAKNYVKDSHTLLPFHVTNIYQILSRLANH